jgi:hypothetical protein
MCRDVALLALQENNQRVIVETYYLFFLNGKLDKGGTLKEASFCVRWKYLSQTFSDFIFCAGTS